MYVDSGTGSILLQVAAAAFFSAVFYFRNVVRWVKSKFKKEN